MKLVVLGTGYVGLTTTVFLAENGYQVTGLDIDPAKIKALKKAQVPFYEPGLDKLLQKNLKKGRLEFTTDYASALKGARAVFVCVGTPSLPSGKIDLRYIKSACQSLAKHASGPLLVVFKSTVPPGIQAVVAPILKKAKFKLEIATCPEFLSEGTAVKDVFAPDRVIIGADSAQAAGFLKKIHSSLTCPVEVMAINSAQLVKYASNSFLATKISFINQLANLADQVGGDIQKVAKGLGQDRRISDKFLRAGIGYGGSCFPKDTKALVQIGQQNKTDLSIVKAAIKANDDQVDQVLAKTRKLVGSLQGKKIFVLGLAFKPETDDLRDSRSLVLIKLLLKEGARVVALDPVAQTGAKKELNGQVEFVSSVTQGAKDAHALVLVTEWAQFARPQWAKLKKLMKAPNIIDGRNFWDPGKIKKAGFRYLGVGRS